MADYSHPHDSYLLRDNTLLSDLTTQNSGPVLFQPFFSDKGIDNKIVDLNEYNKTLADFGEADINSLGQSYYHVLNWLENGGVVKGIRLTAANATNANIILMLDIKTVQIQKTNKSGDPLYTDISGNETTIASGNVAIMLNKAIVNYRLETFTQIAINDTDIKTLMRTRMTEDTDGLHLPILCAVCRGKGSYGQSYRFRMTPASQRDKESTFRNYNFEILKNDNGLSKIKGCPVNVSTYPKAKNVARQSEYVQDVIERQNFPIKVIALEEAYYSAATKLQEVIAQSIPSIALEDIDVITFLDRTVGKYANVEVQANSIDLTALEGYGLESGSDGDFAITNANRWDAMYTRLEDLFKGTIDPSINDIREHKMKVTLDANFPLEVKKLMQAWRDRRDDHVLVLDASLMYTNANLKAYLKDELKLDNYGIIPNTQNFDTYDKYTGRNITVTVNYLWSILLPRHFKEKGSHIPFAGVDIPLNEWIIEGSLRPAISEPEDKTEIYNLRGNYIEKEAGKYIFATNVTSQVRDSELSYSNNVFVLYEIKEDLKSLSAIFRFKFNDSTEDFKVLNKLATQKVEKYVDAKCKVVKVSVIEDETDPKGKTVKTLCGIGFKNFDLNNNIEVEIDRY